MPSRVVDLFACWWTGGSTESDVVWKIVPSCLLWCLWKERKERSNLRGLREDIGGV
jgi:hypothetical protein